MFISLWYCCWWLLCAFLLHEIVRCARACVCVFINILHLKLLKPLKLIRVWFDDAFKRQAIGTDKLLIELIFHARPHPMCVCRVLLNIGACVWFFYTVVHSIGYVDGGAFDAHCNWCQKINHLLVVNSLNKMTETHKQL